MLLEWRACRHCFEPSGVPGQGIGHGHEYGLAAMFAIQIFHMFTAQFAFQLSMYYQVFHGYIGIWALTLVFCDGIYEE